MSTTRGDLPVGLDAPLHGVWEGTIGSGSLQTIDAAAATSMDGRTLAGDIVGYRVVNKSTGTVTLRLKHDSMWDGSSTAGTDVVFARGSTGTVSMRGQGTRVAAIRLKGYADETTGSADSAVDVHVRLWFRGVD